MQQGTILALAVAMVVFATPLFFDLGLSIMRAICSGRGGRMRLRRRTIRLAVVGSGARRGEDDCADGAVAEGGRRCNADLRGDAQLLGCDRGDGGESRGRGCGTEQS